MFDTYVTVVGNVLHPPEQRQTSNTGAVVTTFKIASTARRMDRQTGKWIDGNSLRVRVTCWRSLAHNVAQSVKVGDPLVVHGRLFTRDWTDAEGNKRLAYELEAMAVGHDLSRGRAFFERVRPRTTTSAIEDADAEARVGGEPTEPVPDSEAVQFDDTPFEAVFDQPAAADPLDAAADPLDAAADPVAPAVGHAPLGDGDSAGEGTTEPDSADESGLGSTDESGEEVASGRRRGPRRTRVPA